MLNLKRIGTQCLIIYMALLFCIPTAQATGSIPWVKVYGKARDISVGANGAVWQVGADSNAWRWDGNRWSKIKGRKLQRLAVDKDGNAWAIGENNVIYRSSQDKFEKFHTGRALDIGIGANGAKWVVGTDRAAWRFTGNNWKKIGGANFERIAVDQKGNAWVINNRDEIFQFAGGNHFKKLPGLAKDIGIGADGSVWIAGVDTAPYLWNNNQWQKHTGGISSISVDPKGLPWVINSKREIFADKRSASYKNPPSAQHQKPATGLQKPISTSGQPPVIEVPDQSSQRPSGSRPSGPWTGSHSGGFREGDDRGSSSR